ncbi:hypothetical protein J4727_12550 [Providencia rettgeri]|uniref:Uncharacterized protein n=1 Tax=Providencia rettgeri TaxID=587 RepID=A0A939NHF8_PRORE|nr:hypothetical protein [Providencia rettgeri]
MKGQTQYFRRYKALGGMYANQVKLVSTESGGINLSNVQANQHDLTLTVDGKITLAGNIQGKKTSMSAPKTCKLIPMPT